MENISQLHYILFQWAHFQIVESTEKQVNKKTSKTKTSITTLQCSHKAADA